MTKPIGLTGTEINVPPKVKAIEIRIRNARFQWQKQGADRDSDKSIHAEWLCIPSTHNCLLKEIAVRDPHTASSTASAFVRRLVSGERNTQLKRYYTAIGGLRVSSNNHASHCHNSSAVKEKKKKKECKRGWKRKRKQSIFLGLGLWQWNSSKEDNQLRCQLKKRMGSGQKAAYTTK